MTILAQNKLVENMIWVENSQIEAKTAEKASDIARSYLVMTPQKSGT